MIKKVYFWFIVLYPFVFANMLLSDASHTPENHMFSFFSFVPREIRYFEALMVLGVFLYSMIARRSIPRRDFRALLSMGAIILLAIVGGVANGSRMQDVFQNVMLFLGPLFVMFTAKFLKYGPQEIHKAIQSLKSIVFIMLPFALVQFIAFRPTAVSPPDIVAGLLNHSHSFAILAFSLYFLFLFQFKNTGSWKDLLLTAIMFTLGFIGYNEKVTLFVLLASAFVFLGWIRVKRVSAAFSVLGVAAIFVFVFELIDPAAERVGGLRYEELFKQDIEDLGLAISYLRIPQVMSESTLIPIIGAGAGNYGTPVVRRKYASDRTISDLAMKYNYATIVGLDAGISGAHEWTLNLATGFLIECGLAATALFLFLLVGILRRLAKGGKGAAATELHQYGKPLMMIVLMLIFNAMVSDISGWTDPVLVYPWFLVIGILLNCFDQDTLLGRFSDSPRVSV